MEIDLLMKLNSLYKESENGLRKSAYDIQSEFGIDANLWHKLVSGGIIKNVGTGGTKPVYKWINLAPDIKLVNVLMTDYATLIENNIKQTNNNAMIQKKDMLFNWVVPESTPGRIITEDFRLTAKNYTFYIGRNFLRINLLTDIDNIKVSFLLNEDEPGYLVFSPPAGVPYFKFSPLHPKSGKNNSPTLANKSLALKFIDFYHLDKSETARFTLTPFQRINGLMLFRIDKEQ